jgi:hypothetical protein
VDDAEIVAAINRLADAEHELERKASSGKLADAEHEELRRLELQLDQCWDLLRQRRARRHAGADPDDARARPIDTVENYQQ